MSWCPKCKIEYVSSIENCNECGSKLVEFLTDDQNTESEGGLDQSKINRIVPRSFFSSTYRTALVIKLIAGIYLFFGFVFSIYIAIDYWYKLEGLGQMIHNTGVPFQQFITMFGRCIFISIVIFALGEILQILHEIRRKLCENKVS